jgi:hypothetical protein
LFIINVLFSLFILLAPSNHGDTKMLRNLLLQPAAARPHAGTLNDELSDLTLANIGISLQHLNQFFSSHEKLTRYVQPQAPPVHQGKKRKTNAALSPDEVQLLADCVAHEKDNRAQGKKQIVWKMVATYFLRASLYRLFIAKREGTGRAPTLYSRDTPTLKGYWKNNSRRKKTASEFPSSRL